MRKVILPKYYKEFKCIGPACEDNCCTTNYEITLNQHDYEFMLYKSKLKDKAQTIFEKTPNRHTYARFKLDEQGCCPLLTDEGWCSVYIEDGEEHLPHVCKTYPRIADVRGTLLVDMSLTLGCPEAVRLVCFDEKAHLTFLREDKGYTKDDKKIYKRPIYFQKLREFTWDILYIPDASIEESLYTLGIALSGLSAFEVNPGRKIFDAMEHVRSQVVQGFPRMMYQQQASSYMYQSVFFSCCLQRIGLYLKDFPDSNRRLHALMKIFKDKVPKDLQDQPIESLSSFWLDQISSTVAYQRYQKFMQQHVSLWINYVIWHMNEMDFPKTSWQVFSTRIIFLYVYFRCCLLILAQDKDLNEDDFVWVVQSLHTAFHNKHMVVFMKQVQFGFDQCLDFKTETGFSLTPLILLKNEPQGAD